MPRVVHVIEPRERETRWMWKLPVIRKRLAVLECQARCAMKEGKFVRMLFAG